MSGAPAYEHQFYVKQGESVRTLGADQIRLEVASGLVPPGALICKVGDTVWRSLGDAAAIGLDLPTPQAPPVPNLAPVRPSPAALDEPNPFARPGAGALFARFGSSKSKATLIVWGVSLSVACTVIFWRNGTFYSVAASMGFAETYASLEKSVFGGPGEGTARSAERLFGEIVPADSVPFADVEARVKTPGK